MTPIAASFIRESIRIGDDALARKLLSFQWFDFSELTPMMECAIQENAGKVMSWSDSARLPAARSWVEFESPENFGKVRYYLQCEERETGEIVGLCGARTSIGGFGTDTVGRFIVQSGSDVIKTDVKESRLRKDAANYLIARATTLLEQALCMINQPGLLQKESVGGDKRIVRFAKAKRIPAEVTWGRLTVRPGLHGKRAGVNDDSEPRAGVPLHYVRRYFKPSIHKWVDGYWRGDPEFGTHLKTYQVKQPLSEDAA